MEAAALVISVGALLLAALAYVRPRQGRRPTWIVAGNVVVNDAKSPKIGVTFQGEAVPRVSRSLVFFLNRGFETIEREDIVPTDPLTIVVDGQILDVAIPAVTREPTNFEVTIETNERVRLSFDHLDRNDGAVIEILHSGASPVGVRMEGAIRGTNGLLKQVKSPLWNDPGGFKGPLWALGAMLVIYTVGITLGWWHGLPSLLFIGALAAVWLWLSFDAWRKDRRWLPKKLWEGIGIPIGPSSRKNRE